MSFIDAAKDFVMPPNFKILIVIALAAAVGWFGLFVLNPRGVGGMAYEYGYPVTYQAPCNPTGIPCDSSLPYCLPGSIVCESFDWTRVAGTAVADISFWYLAACTLVFAYGKAVRK